MKKQSRKSRPNASKRSKGQGSPREPQKRDTLKLIRNIAIGGAVVMVAGGLSVRSVMANLAEQDLTKIGNGQPTIVQIHDPQCPMCQALQKETRKALAQFDRGDLQYLVANIRTEEGATLAGKFGVPHVTLLLLDGQGDLKEVLRGQRPADEIAAAFRAAFRLRPAS